VRYLIFFLPLLLCASPFHDKSTIKKLSSSVVKIFTVSVKPNYYQPWQMRTQKFSTGSGVIIDGHYILTAAHVVSNAVYLQVKKNTNPDKFIAHTKWISHDADLALLELEDATFFDDTQSLSLGEMPERQDGVAVYGYPQGGNEISITQGIISRIEQTVYVHSDFDLLALQIDAAINPGNSGGPVFNQEGDIIGIAMQSLSSADNIGYLVPSGVIQHFLDDIKDKRYDGFPDDGLYIQTMENEKLRQHYQMKDRSGILITQVVKGSSCDGYVKKDDVLLQIDGIDVANDATILVEGNGRVAANYLIRNHHIGDTFELTLLREGQILQVNVPAKHMVTLIPFEHEKRPKYLIFGGVVFMPLSKNYLFEWGRNWVQKAPIRFVDLSKNGNFPKEDNEEVVFVQSVLSDRENSGYEITNAIVEKVNDTPINNFSTLITALTDQQSGDVEILLQGGTKIILDAQKAQESNARLLQRYNIKQSAYLE
jgi:S1-C subfamily serine protease